MAIFENINQFIEKEPFLYPKRVGVTLGRNLVTRLSGEADFDEWLRAHETGHYFEQIKPGFGNVSACFIRRTREAIKL